MEGVIYLVRHGIAADAPVGQPDAERALTPAGVRKMTRAAAGLKRLGVRPELVLSSPLRRAQETAAIVAGVLGARVETYVPLAPGHAPDAAVQGLRTHRRTRRIMLVGHQPDLGELASHLLTGATTLAPLPFKKGGVAAIQVGAIPPASAGLLLWFLTPRQLRAMAR